MDAAADVGIVAKAAMFLWFPLAIVLFATMRPQVAMIATIIGGVMFLPERADFQIPGFVPLDKEEVASLAALIGALWRSRGMLARAKPFRGADILVLIPIVAMFGTLAQNMEQIVTPAGAPLQGLTLKDLISTAVKDFLKAGVPFFLGRAMLQSSRDMRDLLSAYVIGGLIYSLMIPIEIRMSPQFHNWVYGYLPHFIGMALRSDGGYRPMLFMSGGGLGVAVFMAAVVIASAGLMKARRPVLGLPINAVTFYLWGILAITRSMASILYSSVFSPLIIAFSPRTQIRFATILVTIALAYPVLRFTDNFPTDKLVSWAESISPVRAESLKFRFDQEKFLVEKAKEKVWFGWGGYGRNRVYDQWGRATITDGYWIIETGARGMFGLVRTFGLLAFPIFVARRKLKKVKEKADRAMIGALALMVTTYIIDLLPNGLFNELPFLVAGGLLGLARALARQPAVPAPIPVTVPLGYPAPQAQPAQVQPLYRQQGPRS